jgi:hypothetical protein
MYIWAFVAILPQGMVPLHDLQRYKLRCTFSLSKKLRRDCEHHKTEDR